MPIQVATNQAPAGVAERCETQGHAITAAKIHDCPRSQVLGRQQPEDPIQPQLPPHELAVSPSGLGKHPLHKTNSVPQSQIGGRLKLNHNSRSRRSRAANQHPQHHAPHHKSQHFFLHMRASQCGKMKWPKRAALQKIPDLHRRNDNRGLEQRIVYKSSGHGQRLIQPEEKSRTHCRQGLKPIDRHDPDEDPDEHGSRRSSRLELLLQQSGDELPRASSESSDHMVAFAMVRMVFRSSITPIPPTTHRSPPSPRPPTPFPRCTPSSPSQSASWFQRAGSAPVLRS